MDGRLWAVDLGASAFLVGRSAFERPLFDEKTVGWISEGGCHRPAESGRGLWFSLGLLFVFVFPPLHPKEVSRLVFGSWSQRIFAKNSPQELLTTKYKHYKNYEPKLQKLLTKTTNYT